MERTKNKELLKIKKRIYNPNQKDIETYSASHAFSCANFQTFLPELKNTDHTTKFRDVVYSQAKAKYERININLIDNLDFSDLSLLEEKSYIMCSFHYGSYKMLASSLIKLNKKFFVVVNNSISKKHREDSHKYFLKCKNRYNNTVLNNIPTLSVQDNGFIFQVEKLLKEGSIMLIFIDGNSGTDGIMEYKGKNMSKISFFNNDIYVKSGLPAIAYIFKVPILPVIAYRENGIKIKSFDPIYPDLSISRKEFTSKTIQHLYDLLQKVIVKNPFEWEGWLYIHKWLDFEKLSNKEAHKNQASTLIFNSRKYVSFIIKEKNFILDKDTHLSYEIGTNVQYAIDGEIDNLTKEELKMLIDKNILI